MKECASSYNIYAKIHAIFSLMISLHTFYKKKNKQHTHTFFNKIRDDEKFNSILLKVLSNSTPSTKYKEERKERYLPSTLSFTLTFF